MKVPGNVSDAVAAGSATSALRSRASFARHPSIADLAAEHSIFATLSRSFTDRSAAVFGEGGFVPLLVGIGAVVCLLLCVGTLLARREKHDDSDVGSVSSLDSARSKSGLRSNDSGDSGRAKVQRQGTRTPKKGLFRLTPPPSTREKPPGSPTPTRRQEAHDLQASSEESSSDDGGSSTRRSRKDAGGGLWAESIVFKDRDSLEVDMGVSGMALAADSADARHVLLIACQAFCLQAMILWYIYKTLLPRPNPDVPKDLPLPLVVAAIYLHFVMCVRDLPQSMLLLRQFTTGWSPQKLVFGTIFVTDALVVPLTQLFVGALFLCTSMTVADVILNACAVNFISTIDNTILEVYRALNELIDDEDDSSDKGAQIELHVRPNLIRLMNWTGCIIPIVPGLFSLVMAHIGLDIWKL